jgi:hypothetical protein
MNLYKNGNEAQQKFLEDFTVYICKGYKVFSTCENILKSLSQVIGVNFLIRCVIEDFKAMGALFNSMHWAKKVMHKLKDESTMNPQVIVQGESIYTSLVLKIGRLSNSMH